MGITKKYLLVLAGMAGLFVGAGQNARAAFELNFSPSTSGPADANSVKTYARCNMGAFGADIFCQHAGNIANGPDASPFLREVVIINSKPYVHMIVGSLTPDPVTGEVFVQETYIAATTLITGRADFYSFSGGKPGCDGSLSVCSQGNIALLSGNGQVLSYNAVGAPLVGNQNTTGNASGDPTRAIIRQVMISSEMEQEFLKADFLLKPKITQTITTLGVNGIKSEFVLDMSANGYSSTAAGTITNKLTLNDPLLPVGSNFFDVTASAQAANVTGGRYTFTAASVLGWTDPIVSNTDNSWNYDEGTYAYSGGGGADLSNVDWQAFKDPLQNP